MQKSRKGMRAGEEREAGEDGEHPVLMREFRDVNGREGAATVKGLQI